MCSTKFSLYFSHLEGEDILQPRRISNLLIDEIQSFIHEYNLRGWPSSLSPASLLALPGLRLSKLSQWASKNAPLSSRIGLPEDLKERENACPKSCQENNSEQDDILPVNFSEVRIQEGGPGEILGLQQKVVIQLLDR